MPAIARLGDLDTGHGCWPPRPAIAGSANVFVNGRPVVRNGDAFDVHTCPENGSHSGVVSGGSSKVLVNGRPIGRIGDAVSCGSVIAQGSSDVFAG